MKSFIHQSTSVGIGEPTVKRKRKISAKFEDGDAEPFNHSDPKLRYRVMYYQMLESTVAGIQHRFDQEGIRVMAELEQVLVRASKDESYSHLITPDITRMYISDIDFGLLCTQLDMLKTLVPNPIANFLKWFVSEGHHSCLLSQVKQIVKLILVLSATNAISERSFSTLQRVKTYMRATMTQQRLNSVMKLTIYKEETSALDVKDIVKLFVGTSARRAERIAPF
jgi:hypothetical protein